MRIIYIPDIFLVQQGCIKQIYLGSLQQYRIRRNVLINNHCISDKYARKSAGHFPWGHKIMWNLMCVTYLWIHRLIDRLMEWVSFVFFVFLFFVMLRAYFLFRQLPSNAFSAKILMLGRPLFSCQCWMRSTLHSVLQWNSRTTANLPFLEWWLTEIVPDQKRRSTRKQLILDFYCITKAMLTKSTNCLCWG